MDDGEEPHMIHGNKFVMTPVFRWVGEHLMRCYPQHAACESLARAVRKPVSVGKSVAFTTYQPELGSV